MLILWMLFVLNGSTTEQIFTNIYNSHAWGTNQDGEGHSGGGSTLRATERYRQYLQNFLEARSIHSVVDLGCGDWEFSKHLNWTNVHYLGIDVVKSVVQKNQKKYGSSHVRFEQMTSNENLPPADLLIIKDVLQHLSHHDIFTILGQFPKYKYVLVTNDVDPKTQSSTNPDIKTGGHRFLDLTKEPFLLHATNVLLYRTAQNAKSVLLVEN